MMKKLALFSSLIISLFVFASCATLQTSSVKVVPHVDLSKYTGTWYEIARYPNRFQEGCVGAVANYTLRKDGTIEVINKCRIGNLQGRIVTATGKAWVVDRDTNAKLKVTYLMPTQGDYWIIDLGQNYEYAVVGHPERKYLWILSRTPGMDEGLYKQILERLKVQGYDVSRLLKTPQAEMPKAQEPQAKQPKGKKSKGKKPQTKN